MTPTLDRLHRDERGMSLVFVGMGFMSFLAAATLAIDVGMFMTARARPRLRRTQPHSPGQSHSPRTTTPIAQRRGRRFRARSPPAAATRSLPGR